MIRRPRKQCKPHNGQPKLTEEQVRWTIYALRMGFALQHEIAFRYHVSQSTIRNIWNRKSYKHIWKELDKVNTSSKQHRRPRL